MCCHLQFTEQSPCSTLAKAILKVGLTNEFIFFIMKNIRKQLALAETLYNKMSLQK